MKSRRLTRKPLLYTAALLLLAAGGALLGLYTLRPSDWAQVLKLVPLALIAAGCIVNMIHRRTLRQRRAQRRPVEKNRSSS
jgi:peptidoglycan/LPS O-acetylase OafA/YrhL